MCGCNKINGMARRKSRISGIKDIGGAAMSLLPLLGGYAVAKILDKTNLGGQYSNLVKLGGGLLLATSTKGMFSGVGLGVALAGAQDIVGPALQSAGIGILEPGMPARYIAGLGEMPPDAVDGNLGY